jgi:hypothetical protein
MTTEQLLWKEISRIGMDDKTAGPHSSIAVDVRGGLARVWDDYADSYVDAELLLQKIRLLPDNCDAGANCDDSTYFWTMINEIEDAKTQSDLRDKHDSLPEEGI